VRPARAAVKTDVRSAAADGSGEIDGPGPSEGRSRDGVSDSHDEVGAVVGHVDVEDVAAVEIDAGACQINVRSRGEAPFCTSPCNLQFLLNCRRGRTYRDTFRMLLEAVVLGLSGPYPRPPPGGPSAVVPFPE